MLMRMFMGESVNHDRMPATLKYQFTGTPRVFCPPSSADILAGVGVRHLTPLGCKTLRDPPMVVVDCAVVGASGALCGEACPIWSK